MANENDVALTIRAAHMIKDENFSFEAWDSIIENTENESLMKLLAAIRNALSYSKETGVIRGIVKFGYLKSLSKWEKAHNEVSSKIAKAGDLTVKEAEAYIKKEKIRIE
ncbi:MAG: hypothetical protein KAJ91_05070 [Candidatus Aenigmarchaeota archaeon]|nr:hypothetical protein [Candidatus Aenigmarchaeota archaeon]MCK5333672.1 hypothetical protein [Candidatus Aenigmarchaeota archaeon]